MKASTNRLLFFFGIISTMTSCQSIRVVLSTVPRPGDQSVAREMLVHDSQGPQATRVTMTAAEAAAFRQE